MGLFIETVLCFTLIDLVGHQSMHDMGRFIVFINENFITEDNSLGTFGTKADAIL